MKILMLYPRVPFPPNKGEKTRAFYQLRYLAARHEVWLATFVDTQQDFEHVAELQGMCHLVEAVPLGKKAALSRGGYNLLRGRTLTEGYYGCKAMWSVVQRWNERCFFDVGFAFSSSMAAYLEDLPVGCRVLDMCDCDSHKWDDYSHKSGWPMSAIFRAEATRLATRERELVQRFDLTFVSTEGERRRFKDPQLQNKVAVFPTVVDLSAYQSAWTVPRDHIIGCVGSMHYRPNVESVLWFHEQVWPAVRSRHPQVQWWIVGRAPVRELRRLGEQDGISVTGAVDDVLPYLRRMRVFVAAVQSNIGVQSKVLDAMAAGRATVITPQGHAGIGAADHKDYLIGRSAHGFADAVSTLLQDHARCTAMSKCAIDFIRRHYDAERVMPEFEALLAAPIEPDRVAL